MISDKRERNCIGHTMSERLAESNKKPPLRLLVIRNGMPNDILILPQNYRQAATAKKLQNELQCAERRVNYKQNNALPAVKFVFDKRGQGKYKHNRVHNGNID